MTERADDTLPAPSDGDTAPGARGSRGAPGTTGSGRQKRGRKGPRVPDPVKGVRVMGRFVRRQVKKAGAAPGTLVHTGRKKMERTRLRFLDYDREELREREIEEIAQVWPFRDSPTVSWVNIDGLHDVELIRRVGEHFGFHPLVLEDVVHVGQRPKMEEYDGYIYLVMPMLSWDEGEDRVEEEQLSLIFGPNWVFTFQERVGDVFEPVRERIRMSNRRIRERGPGYLAYALIDAVVDRYYAILERMGELTEELELRVIEDPDPRVMERLHHLKREMLAVRRAVWPLRDALNGMIRSESELVDDETRVFLRDVYDHAVQVIDTVESLRDVVSGLIDLYLSQVGQKTNDVMKVLTIMASIFIPLTFMAGIYGMNFEYMPELGVRWGYPALLAAMAVVAGAMLVYFRRKGWL